MHIASILAVYKYLLLINSHINALFCMTLKSLIEGKLIVGGRKPLIREIYRHQEAGVIQV